MKTRAEYIQDCIGFTAMFATLGCVAWLVFLVGCSSTTKAPDPARFPDKAKEYNDGYGDGFRKGFSEGLTYNILTQ